MLEGIVLFSHLPFLESCASLTTSAALRAAHAVSAGIARKVMVRTENVTTYGVRPWLDCCFEIKGPFVNDFEHGCHVWFCSSIEDT